MCNGRFRTACIAAAALAALTSACAGSGAMPDPYRSRGCPNVDVLVCKVHSGSKLERASDREQRLCQCRALEHLDF